MSITCQTNQKLEEIEILVILNMTNLKIIMMDSLINVVVILEKMEDIMKVAMEKILATNLKENLIDLLVNRRRVINEF